MKTLPTIRHQRRKAGLSLPVNVFRPATRRTGFPFSLQEFSFSSIDLDIPFGLSCSPPALGCGTPALPDCCPLLPATQGIRWPFADTAEAISERLPHMVGAQCSRGDSNPHPVKGQILNLLRMPIPPQEQIGAFTLSNHFVQ